MSLDGYKKVGFNQKTTTLKHSSGHTLRVVHDKLSAEMRKSIEDLPHYAEGGVVEDEDKEKEKAIAKRLNPLEFEGPEIPMTPEREQDIIYRLNPTQVPTDAQLDRWEGVSPQVAAPVQIEGGAGGEGGMQQQMQAPEQATQVSSAPSGMQSGLGMMQKGLAQEASALGAQGKSEAQSYQQLQQDLAAKQMEFDKQSKPVMEERNHLLQDIASGHIDPNRFVANMSTPQRIMSAIGLILGGVGSGLTGKENMAYESLKRHIDADIAAQKTDLGKKETLLNANMRSYKDVQDAYQITKVNMMDIAALKMKEIAAKSQDPLAKARLLQSAGKLQMEADQLMIPVQRKQELQKAMATGQIQDPAMLIPALIPSQHQAKANEELAMMKGYVQATKGIDQAVSEIKKLGTIASTIPYSDAKIKFDLVNAKLSNLIRSSMKGQGVITDREQETLIDPQLFSKGNTEEQLQMKADSLKAFLKSKVSGGTPTLKGHGIDLEQFESTAVSNEARLSPQEKQYLAWAKSNPSNPKAQMLMKKLGVE
jgi:hypothetical protein